ncbi:flippase [Vibrio cholerae]|uniref:flippase n=1 Tax=Vibrio cholerae TaxID=666 RepID=UPI0013B41F1C|nr:flippase [Vibrio cholerae]
MFNAKNLKNIFWMALERMTSIVGGIVITILTARYLGPEKVGVISFSLALIAIINPIGQLGSNATIFNRIAKKKSSGIFLIETSGMIRKLLYLISSIFCYAYASHLGLQGENMIVLLVILISGYFSSIDILKYYYDGLLKSKISTLSSQAGLFSSLILRFLFVKIEASYIFFTLPYLINSFLPFILRLSSYRRDTSVVHIKDVIRKTPSLKSKYIKYMFSSGVPIVISSLSVVIYQKTSQIVLANYVDMQNVGILNAGLTLANGWTFIPVVIMTSLVASLLKENKDINMGFSRILILCVFVSLPIVFLLFLFGSWIIENTYGNDFIGVVNIFNYLILASFFSVIGVVTSRYIILKGGHNFLMIKTISMAILNIIMSLYIIPKYGLHGAVITILITEIISSTLANYLYVKLEIFRLHFIWPMKFLYRGLAC